MQYTVVIAKIASVPASQERKPGYYSLLLQVLKLRHILLVASIIFVIANQFFVGHKSRVNVFLLVSTVGKRSGQEVNSIRCVFF